MKHLLALLVSFMTFGSSYAEEQLSLKALFDLEVETASNKKETLAQAPATLIVITAKDIKGRGYKSLAEIFDDLPGLDVIRPNGDTAFKNYWRGWRNTIGSPYLFMVDGRIFNHLYFNDVMATMSVVPLSNIKQVEVVYGPTSSVYGANAFMGVINVKTKSAEELEGLTQVTHFDGTLLGGSNNRKIADVTATHQLGKFRLSLTGRFEEGRVDDQNVENQEFLKDKYYADSRIWGEFNQNPNIGSNRFLSKQRNRALEIRADAGELTLGSSYYLRDSGYGLVYPGDKVQSNGSWKHQEYDLYLRFKKKMNDKVTSRTLVRYRESDIVPDSFFVDGYWSGDDNAFLTAFSFWQSHNYSTSLYQDFDVDLNDMFSFVTGFKFEKKDLQTNYDVMGEGQGGTGGDYIAANSIRFDSYDFPDHPQKRRLPWKRVYTEDVGFYIQSKTYLTKEHQLNLGLRGDKNSNYSEGVDYTNRFAYVGEMNQMIFKFIYGEAFQEPNPRTLYGGWSGSGSNSKLKSEKSATTEISFTYLMDMMSNQVSIYNADNKDTVVTTADGAENLGSRQVQGLDYHFNYFLPGGAKIWAFASLLLKADEDVIDEQTKQKVKSRFIGDLAKTKVNLGTTVDIGDFGVNFRMRYIGERECVESNKDKTGKIRTIDAYTTADMKLSYKDPFNEGITWGLVVTNLTGAEYDHPGTREANAGEVAGNFDANNTYSGGSESYYNSTMPQAGTEMFATIDFNF